MNTETLKIVAQTAGMSGLAIAALVILFRSIIQKGVLQKLTNRQSYRLLTAIVIIVSSIIAVEILKPRFAPLSAHHKERNDGEQAVDLRDSTGEVRQIPPAKAMAPYPSASLAHSGMNVRSNGRHQPEPLAASTWSRPRDFEQEHQPNKPGREAAKDLGLNEKKFMSLLAAARQAQAVAQNGFACRAYQQAYDLLPSRLRGNVRQDLIKIGLADYSSGEFLAAAGQYRDAFIGVPSSQPQHAGESSHE